MMRTEHEPWAIVNPVDSLCAVPTLTRCVVYLSQMAAKSAPRKSPKTAKRWKTAAVLELLLAERAGEPVVRVSVFGSSENWDASLIANPVGNAERKARFKSLVGELRRDFDLLTE